MFKRKTIILLFACLPILLFVSLDGVTLAKDTKTELPKGIWVTVFTEKKVLYSMDAATTLVEFCRENGIDEIYLQLYRAGKAYYDSSVTDRAPYEEMLESAGADTIDFLLAEAKKRKIKVFAWVNVLSLAQNDRAGIINKFDKTVLTKDQHLMTPLMGKKGQLTDKYYIKEKQLFLEPGDPRVREYVLTVIDEIMERYPGLNGIHLDYIRYPNAIPYLPDSRFNKYGLSYGYGERNLRSFRQTTGIDPLKMEGERYECLSWDNWKRDRVTTLVGEISRRVRKRHPDSLISCAVIPSLERAYSVAFQDWSLWLEEGTVDFIVLMNYTVDNRLAKETARSALAHRGQGKVYIGIGAFLMKEKPGRFAEQYKEAVQLDPDGIVFFSYDDMTREMLEPL